MPFLKVFGGGGDGPGSSSGSRLPVRLATTAPVDVVTGGLLVIDGQATADLSSSAFESTYVVALPAV